LVAVIADDIIVIIMSVITIASKLLKIFGKQLLG
jgi:hypothetical protein